MADLNGFDEQDQSEVFDEDNTNPQERGPGEEAEQFEDLLDVYDVTTAVGDDDDEDARIGDEMDDDDIVSASEDDGDSEAEDDDRRDQEAFDEDEDLIGAEGEGEDPDDLEIAARRAEEVELEYIGDLNDLAGASSAAQAFEADGASDDDDDDSAAAETLRDGAPA
jgi:hypothetical protein